MWNTFTRMAVTAGTPQCLLPQLARSPLVTLHRDVGALPVSLDEQAHQPDHHVSFLWSQIVCSIRNFVRKRRTRNRPIDGLICHVWGNASEISDRFKGRLAGPRTVRAGSDVVDRCRDD